MFWYRFYTFLECYVFTSFQSMLEFQKNHTKVGEILVVCDQGVWNSDIKKYLDTNLTQFIMPYFPDVTTFELIHRKPERFEGAIKRHRNTLFLKLESSHKGGVKVKYNKVSWAKNQHVVEQVVL